jgi:hypothetical protein
MGITMILTEALLSRIAPLSDELRLDPDHRRRVYDTLTGLIARHTEVACPKPDMIVDAVISLTTHPTQYSIRALVEIKWKKQGVEAVIEALRPTVEALRNANVSMAVQSMPIQDDHKKISPMKDQSLNKTQFKIDVSQTIQITVRGILIPIEYEELITYMEPDKHYALIDDRWDPLSEPNFWRKFPTIDLRTRLWPEFPKSLIRASLAPKFAKIFSTRKKSLTWADHTFEIVGRTNFGFEYRDRFCSGDVFLIPDQYMDCDLLLNFPEMQFNGLEIDGNKVVLVKPTYTY